MWATFTAAPAGKLFNDTLKSTVLVCELIVMTAVPRAVFSAFVTGGTSLAGDSWTVKMVVLLGVVGVDLLPHPAAPIARMLTTIASRFIAILLVCQKKKGQRERQYHSQADR